MSYFVNRIPSHPEARPAIAGMGAALETERVDPCLWVEASWIREACACCGRTAAKFGRAIALVRTRDEEWICTNCAGTFRAAPIWGRGVAWPGLDDFDVRVVFA